jgi:hypothetical protein
MRPPLTERVSMRQLRTLSSKSLFVVAAAACAAFAAFTVSARTAAASTCPPPPSSVQPFVPWSDANDYVLTTGGAFEPSAQAWSLQGGAGVVADNAPNALDPTTDDHALYLPAGASATSPCTTAPKIVGLVRFFTKVASTGGQLKVEVLVKGKTYLAGTITAGSGWAPAPMLASNAPAYKGAVAYQVRLTASGAAFTVDDVYFDPYSSK